MDTDEQGNNNLGSDHNQLRIAFGGRSAVKRCSEPTGQHKVTQREAQTITRKLEAEAEDRQIEAYEDLMQ